MTKLRKFFASSVMVMTVVVMSGLTAPMTTNAAASAGDLIKKDGLSAVYYLGEDGKRYVFPNEATYKSWYSDFSGVVTVSADELASYPLGANVVVRPGTKLVKITTDPKVYAVEANGTLRWVQTEADAIALYGANWASRVIDVADSFFTNYTIGTPLASDEVPAGSLVQKTGEGNIYYYDGTDYRLIEDEVAFLANKFQFANVLTIDSFTPSGSTITGAEAAIIKTSQGGVATGWQPGQGTGVTVSLNSMTPASQSVPTTVGRIPFTKVNLTASNDGIAYVDAITITRSGLTTFASNNFKVWAEKDGNIIASKRTLTTNDNVILNFSPVLTIPAGQTITLDILADVTDVSGNGALGIASASAISASGSTVSGSFPIVGNLMSFASYEVTALTFATSTVNASVNIGDEEVELATFEVTTSVASTTGRDTVLKTLTLRNGGVEDLANVTMDLYLENNGEKVTDYATYNGRYVTFTFSNGGMEMLREDGGTESFTIKGDIIGKDNTDPNSINLKLYKSEEFYAYEKATGFGVKVIGDVNADFGATKIESGAIDVSKKVTNPSNQDIIKGSKDVVVLLANIKADEQIATDGMNVNYTGDIDSFQNIKVYLNNVLLSSFDLSTSTATVETIDSSLTLNKGNNEVKVTVDVKTTASSSKTFTAKLTDSLFSGHNPEYTSSGNVVSPSDINGSAQGATLTVAGGALTFTRNDGYAAGKKIAQGSTDVTLGKFAVKATNDAIKLTSISLSQAVDGGVGTATDYSHIYDMKLFVDGSQIGTTRNFTSSGAVFSSLNYTIAQNSVKVVELRGSLTSEAAGTATTSFRTTMTINAQDSLGKVIAGTYAENTARFEITSNGSITVTVGADTPGANILVAKAGVEQEIAQYTATAEDDSANVTELVIVNSVDASDAATTSARIYGYKLYLGSTLLDSAIPVGATTTFYITNNKLVIPANESKTVTLKAIFNPIEVSTDSARTLALEIVGGKVKSSSGEELSGTSINLNAPVSKTMTILKTKPTFAHVSNATGGASLNQELLRFSVTADANEDLQLKTLKFTLYGSGKASTSGFKLYEVGGDQIGTITNDANFTGLTSIVGKGATKTYRVTGNTSLLSDDKTFGIALDNTTVDNISWGEKFVTTYTARDGANLASFPIDGGTTTY